MTPTNELRFVRRWIDPNTPKQRTALILQQKWTGEVEGTTSGGMLLVTSREEWRDVPVAVAGSSESRIDVLAVDRTKP